MKRILCTWPPNWPIQRLRAERPELNGRPVVLWAEIPGRGQRVMHCSDEATRCGVRLHAPLANVASLGRRMAREGHCELHRPAGDLEALEKLAVACERFSPTVGLEAVENGGEPSCLLMNVTGLVHLFHSEERLVEQLIAECRRRGYTARVAVADTVGAAWAMAHYAPSQLPVDALRLSARTLDLLGQLGITEIEQLLRLPRASLTSRFGNEVARRIDQLFGHIDEPIIAHRPVAELVARWALEHPAERAEVLQHVLRQLLERLAGRLAEQGLGAIELVCRLRGDSGRSIELPVCLFEPTAQLPRLMNLVELQWQRRPPPGAVTHIEVEVTAAAALAPRQYELFADERDCPRELAALVNQLSNRLGREQVVRSQLRADAQPEKAFRYVPLAGAAGKKTRPPRSRSRETSGDSGTLTSSATIGQRPLTLFTPPIEIEVVAVQPAGSPVMFTYQQRRHEITQLSGPERIQTGWWRGRSIERDYWRVETAAGNRYWIFRRLGDGRWFLHGEFT